jgi:hypothetical protein
MLEKVGAKGDSSGDTTAEDRFVSCCLCPAVIQCVKKQRGTGQGGNRIRYLLFIIPPFLVSSSAAPTIAMPCWIIGRRRACVTA